VCFPPQKKARRVWGGYAVAGQKENIFQIDVIKTNTIEGISYDGHGGGW
jgi:hypothetical protein